MTRILIFLATLAPAGVAQAEEIVLKPIGEARLRYEQVDQDGLPADAEALTLRVRAGVEAKAGSWSALIEGQGNLAIIDDYFDGLHGAATRPLVGDPDNIALARAQSAMHRPPLHSPRGGSGSASTTSVSSAASAFARTARASMRCVPRSRR